MYLPRSEKNEAGTRCIVDAQQLVRVLHGTSIRLD